MHAVARYGIADRVPGGIMLRLEVWNRSSTRGSTNFCPGCGAPRG